VIDAAREGPRPKRRAERRTRCAGMTKAQVPMTNTKAESRKRSRPSGVTLEGRHSCLPNVREWPLPKWRTEGRTRCAGMTRAKAESGKLKAELACHGRTGGRTFLSAQGGVNSDWLTRSREDREEDGSPRGLSTSATAYRSACAVPLRRDGARGRKAVD